VNQKLLYALDFLKNVKLFDREAFLLRKQITDVAVILPDRRSDIIRKIGLFFIVFRVDQFNYQGFDALGNPAPAVVKQFKAKFSEAITKRLKFIARQFLTDFHLTQ